MGVFRRAKRTSSDRPTTQSGGGGGSPNAGLFSRIFGRKPPKSSQASRETARKRRSVRMDAPAPINTNQGFVANGKRDSYLPTVAASAPTTPAESRMRKDTTSTLSPSTGGGSEKERGGGLLGFVRKRSTMSLRNSYQPPPSGMTSTNANTNWTAPNGRLTSAPLYDKLASRPLSAYEPEPQTPQTPTKDALAPKSAETNVPPPPPSAMGNRAKRFSVGVDKRASVGADRRASTMRAPPPPRTSVLPDSLTTGNADEGDVPPALPPKPATIGRGAAPTVAESVLAQDEQDGSVDDDETAYHIRATSPPPRPASALETLEMTAPLSLSPSLTGVPQMPQGASLIRGRSISGPGRSVNSAVTTVTTTADESTVISPPPAPARDPASPGLQQPETPILRSAGETVQSGTTHVPATVSTHQNLAPPQSGLHLALPDEPLTPTGEMVLPSPVGVPVEYMPGSPASEPSHSPTAEIKHRSPGAEGIASAAAVGAAAAAAFAGDAKEDGEDKAEDVSKVDRKAVAGPGSGDLSVSEGSAASPVTRATALSLPFDERRSSLLSTGTEPVDAHVGVSSADQVAPVSEVKNNDEVKKLEEATEAKEVDVPTELAETATKPSPAPIDVTETSDSASDHFETPLDLVSPTQIPSPAADTPTIDLTDVDGPPILSPTPVSPMSTAVLTDSSDSTLLSRSTAVSTPTIPLEKIVPAKLDDNASDKVIVQDVNITDAASPVSSRDEIATFETVATATSAHPAITVATTFDNANVSDDEEYTPQLSPSDSPIMTDEFKAATAITPAPAVPPKDQPSELLGIGRPDVPGTPRPRMASVGTQTASQDDTTPNPNTEKKGSPSTPLSADAPVVPEKDSLTPPNGLAKTLSVRAPSKSLSPATTPQRASTLTPRRVSDGSPRTPGSYKGSPRSPSTPATPGTPGTPGSDATLDDFMGLFKTVIARDKSMSIREAARRAEQREVA